MEVVPLSDDAANPVGDLNGENANVAISEMQQQVETAPLLNAESLGEVLRDVPGEHLALLRGKNRQQHWYLRVAWLLTLEK